MNHLHTLPCRRFSMLNRIIPTSSPSVSGDTHPVPGLNASANPYLPQILSPYLSFIACIAAIHISGATISDPPAAHGTTLPSTFECNGGPPHALYPLGLVELVIPQMLSVYPGNSFDKSL